MSTETPQFDPAESLDFATDPRFSVRGWAKPFFPRRTRAGLAAAIVLLHLVALLVIVRPGTDEEAVVGDPIDVFFIDTTRRPERPVPPAIRRPRDAPRAAARATAPVRVSRPSVTAAPAKEVPHARLFERDGSIALPDEVLKDLASVTDPRRTFSYQMPGLMAAREFLDRPPAIEYEGTRFEDGWVEEADPVTEALAKAVEKTTATIRIPLPRSPGSQIVCKVSLLAMGGACGIVNNGEGYLVVLDDPDTLDAEEDAQCRAWWSDLVKATTPEQWRAALDRYERECRKPLLVPKSSPG